MQVLTKDRVSLPLSPSLIEVKLEYIQKHLPRIKKGQKMQEALAVAEAAAARFSQMEFMVQFKLVRLARLIENSIDPLVYNARLERVRQIFEQVPYVIHHRSLKPAADEHTPLLSAQAVQRRKRKGYIYV